MEQFRKQPAAFAGGMPADVLIVEDDLIIAMDLEEIVQRLGVKATRTATNVAQALELIATAPPEFALLDVGLRDETSLAVAERLDALSVPFAAVDVEAVLKNWKR